METLNVTQPKHAFTNQKKCTHTQPFNGLLSGTTRGGQYQKKHSPTHTHPDHRTSFIFITFLHLLRSLASSLFSLSARQSSLTTSLQVLFGLPLGLELHTPCISSPYHQLLFAAYPHSNAACSAVIPMLCHLYQVSLSSLLRNLSFSLTPHIHLTILISAR